MNTDQQIADDKRTTASLDQTYLQKIVNQLFDVLKNPQNWETDSRGSMLQINNSLIWKVLTKTNLPPRTKDSLAEACYFPCGGSELYLGENHLNIKDQLNFAKKEAKKTAKIDPQMIQNRIAKMRVIESELQGKLQRIQKQITKLEMKLI